MSRKEALERLSIGTYGTEGDVLDWTYWDEEILAAATLTQRLFTVQLGGAGKTLAQTNLTTAGQIPQGQKFDVMALKLFYTTSGAKATADVQTWYSMLANTTMSIKLQNKETMGQWTLQEILGMPTQFALTPTVAGDNIPVNLPKYPGIFPLNKKITLAALTPFEVTIVHHVAPGAALNGDSLKVGLSGILTRVS